MNATGKELAGEELAKEKIGFALGGFGGFNAYGVGFLQAARQLQVTPDIVTCTSGMVAWVAKWLEGEDLESLILEKCRQDTRFPPSLGWLNMLRIALLGSPGISRSALSEYWRRLLTLVDISEELPDQVLARLLPGQLWVPVRGREEMEHIAYVFNTSQVPVVFNTVHVKSGRPYLHINHAAKEFLKVTEENMGEVGGPKKYTPISAETVGGALWLYFYGFDNAAERRVNPLGLVDGAYNRQFIISEIHQCKRIYTVRAMNTKWLDHPPRDLLDIEMFKEWLWVNSSYTTEVAGMETVNNLVKQGVLQPPDYEMIELIEVQIPFAYPRFQQVYEKKGVYELALNEGLAKLG